MMLQFAHSPIYQYQCKLFHASHKLENKVFIDLEKENNELKSFNFF